MAKQIKYSEDARKKMKAGIDQVAAALGPELDVHLVVGPQPRDLVVGPLDRLGARFAQAVRVLLVGDVDPAARLADAVKLLEDQFGPVEHLQRMAAGDEVEAIVLQHHLGGIAIDIFDVRHAEIGRHLARIVEAGARMVERQDARRLQFLRGVLTVLGTDEHSAAAEDRKSVV